VLRPDIVDVLADSMAIQGQLHPITVRSRRGSGYTLVAGLHRLEAAKKLKQKTIRCTIFADMDADQAELAELHAARPRAAGCE
jgi:ParB family transcriptional regulator, chromosome partitioning protein